MLQINQEDLLMEECRIEELRGLVPEPLKKEFDQVLINAEERHKK